MTFRGLNLVGALHCLVDAAYHVRHTICGVETLLRIHLSTDISIGSHLSSIAMTMMLSVSITITPIMHIAKFSKSILTAHAAVPSFCVRPLESNIDPIVYFLFLLKG